MDRGRPTGVTVRSEIRGDLQGRAGLGLQWPRGNAAPNAAPPSNGANSNSGANPGGPPPRREDDGPPSVPRMLGANGRIDGRAVLETRYTFPAGINGDQLQRDPLGALQQYGQQMQETGQSTLRLTASVRGQATGTAQLNTEAEMTFTGRTNDIAGPEVLRRAWNGDFEGAARHAGAHTAVEGRVFDVRERNWGVRDLGGDAFGVGLSGTFQATRRSEDPPRLQFRLAGSEFVDQTPRMLESLRRQAVQGHIVG